jgi:hypothetical protein
MVMRDVLRIRNFIYNGFMVQDLPGHASYTGEFLHWTSDPGIAAIKCSDGKIRLIPSCNIDGVIPPEPDYNELRAEGNKVDLFGASSNSC